KFLSPAFPMNLTWMQSKKITIRILLFLSIYLKVTLCLRALSVCNVTFQEYDSEILLCAAPATPNPKWRKGCGRKIIGVAERKLVWQHHHPIVFHFSSRHSKARY